MASPKPRFSYATWEITLRCNMACIHCGSSAGRGRPDELTTDEALDLVGQLADVGITVVSLLGGETFLRPDWLRIAAAIHAAGMRCSVTTGGWGVTEAMVRGMKESGISTVAVSIDGMEEAHDAQRRKGSWARCFAALAHAKAAGLSVSATTQLNRHSAPRIPELYERLAAAGVGAWQLQLTGPMGNAVGHPEMLFQPAELLDLMPMLARVARRAHVEGIVFGAANNLGYYGPYERLLRSNGDPWGFWRGPSEGLAMIGIESDGSVKADPTLPSRPYIGGNIRERPLREILQNAPELTFNLGADTPNGTDHLWGFCRACEFARLCRGGDAFTAHAFFDRRGNHPYCHHRALVQRERGIRERLVLQQGVLQQAGPIESFGCRVWEIVEEEFDAAWPADDILHFTAEQVVWPPDWCDPEGPATPPSSSVGDVYTRPPTRPTAILPRSAWTDKLDYMLEVTTAKAALDRAEADLEVTDRRPWHRGPRPAAPRPAALRPLD